MIIRGIWEHHRHRTMKQLEGRKLVEQYRKVNVTSTTQDPREPKPDILADIAELNAGVAELADAADSKSVGA